MAMPPNLHRLYALRVGATRRIRRRTRNGQCARRRYRHTPKARPQPDWLIRRNRRAHLPGEPGKVKNSMCEAGSRLLVAGAT